jgi:hypothetical protein
MNKSILRKKGPSGAAARIRFVKELKQKHPEAFSILQDKAHWEKISLPAVIYGWGDPREW